MSNCSCQCKSTYAFFFIEYTDHQEKSPHFWILTRAVRDFVENEGGGQLPLSGKLPDMKSDTLNYIGLQKIYREKALADFNAVKKRVHGFIEDSEVSIPDETIELFCKNAAHITVIQYQPLTDFHVQPEKLGLRKKKWMIS